MERFKEYLYNSSYLVGDKGTVHGIRKHNLGSVKSDGYVIVNVKGVGVRYIHRMVWETFKGKIPKGKEINHSNGNKSDNRLENLELMTRKENIVHSYEVLDRYVPTGKDHWAYGKKFSKKTREKMRDKKLGAKHPSFKGWWVIDGVEYASSYEAERETGINKSTVRRRCLREVSGYYFKQFKTK